MANENVYTTPSDTGYGPTSNPGPGVGQATIDAPQTNKAGTELDLEAKSVKTIGHAWNICKATEQANRTRAARVADVQSLHDGAPPRSAGANIEKAKNWQSNASTNWLSGIVGRVAQRFVNSIVAQLYVTSSSLSESTANWKEKTDHMRAKFTALVRSWNGYTGLINSECVETALQGYCYAVFLDPYTWKPTFFKQDWAYCPEYSGQHARDLQFFVAKIDYKLDEYIRLFAFGQDAAESNGYDIDNCVWAANQAQMQNPPTDATTTQFRTFVEMINEGVLGLTYTSAGARIVPCYLLFNREYDGKVSFWLVHRDSGKQLRFSFKLFPTMEYAIAMFSFETGNGCIHSSKGLGRKLAALATMKEVFRNGIIDNSRISGMMVVRTTSGDLTKVAPKMMSPFIYLDSSIEIPNQQFQANGDTYEKVDRMIDAWAEQSVGAYIPVPVDESKVEKTATQAQIDARRESESADIQIRRQLDQFSTMTQIQQLRAFSDENIDAARRLFEKIAQEELERTEALFQGHRNIDPEVIRTLVEVMDADITDEEIREWRDSPASPYAHVAEAALQQGLMVAADAFAGDPNVDQTRLKFRKLEGLVGADEAARLFIPKPDETVVAEAVRQQRMESINMMTAGVPLPASARDNLLIHGAELQQLLTNFYGPVLSQPGADPQMEKGAELNLNHLGDHLRLATPEQLKLPAVKELEKFYEGFKKNLAESVQIRASAKAGAQAVMEQLRTEVPAAGTEEPAGAVPLPTSPQVAKFELPPAPPRARPVPEKASA